MDVLDFIDSPDIRTYYENRTFTPAEQAVLCMKSNLRSYDEKVAFVATLLEAYPDSDFPLEDFDDTWDIRSDLQRMVIDWQMNGPAKDEEYIDVVYVTYMKFLDSRDEYGDRCIFSTYRKAYEALQASKEEMLDETDSPVCACIIKEWVDHPEKRITYTLNEDLQIIKTSSFWEDYEFDVPAPFQKGDILLAAEERYAPTASYNEDAFFCVAGERMLHNEEKALVFARFLRDGLHWLCGHEFRLRLRNVTEDDAVPKEIEELAKAIRSDEISFPEKEFPRKPQDDHELPF